MVGHGVGLVLRSELPSVQKGDHVYGVFGKFLLSSRHPCVIVDPWSAHQEYCVISNTDGIQVIDNKHNLPWSAYIGVAGMPGLCCHTDS